VRKTGAPVELTSRCDSPLLRRELRINISLDGDLLRYDSAITAETGRARPLPWPVADAEALVAMCSFCNRYRFPLDSEEWKEFEALFIEPDLPERFAVTHGICGPCAKLWYPGF
jgi:hypothetical protein